MVSLLSLHITFISSLYCDIGNTSSASIAQLDPPSIHDMATMQDPRPNRPIPRHHLTDSAVPLVERHPAPAQLNLSSNNPFRRAVSPNTAANSSQPYNEPYNAPLPKSNGYIDNNNNENRPPPRSTNPFLDNYVAPSYPISIPSQNAQRSPTRPMPPPGYSLSASPKKPAFGSSVPTQMMVCLSCFSRSGVKQEVV